MHDPSTVAFDIKYPWKTRPSLGWPKGYRNTFITIWHEDPLNFEGKCGCRDDDSCGWSRPPMTLEEREQVKKWAKAEYSTIFGKQVAVAEKKSYAYICYHPSCYDAIYWIWRYIKHEKTKRGVWRYIDRRNALTSAELEEIYSLASNPIDNLQQTFMDVRNLESFERLYLLVFRAYQSHNRPWYRHPRWHVHHWHFQIHPLQKLKRRLFTRCRECGGHFGWNESPIGSWGGNEVWHDRCDKRGPIAAASSYSSPIHAEETTGSVH